MTLGLGVMSSMMTVRGSTVTSKLQLVVLPERSVAVQVTVVVPTGNRLPEAGVQTTTGASSQSSAASTSNSTSAPAASAQSNVTSDGQAMNGATSSGAKTGGGTRNAVPRAASMVAFHPASSE